MTEAQGASTVSTVNEIFPGDGGHPSAPYGLGMRVPMLIVSPWTKGGWVNSEVFDHTSLIRFLEARFGKDHPELIEPNITPWRRAVAGDLTSAFDFKKPNARKVKLPATQAYLPTDLNKDSYAEEAPVPPVDQQLPIQETGVRPARALPYSLHAHGSAQSGDGSFGIAFGNTGKAGAVFQVRSGDGLFAPRTYTVEPGKQPSGDWDVAAQGATDYDLSVYGPNGFFRGFKGGVAAQGRAKLDVQAAYDEQKGGITLNIVNLAARSARVMIVDNYFGKEIHAQIKSLEAMSKSWRLRGQFGWYDLTITVEGDAGFEYRLAGHVETGKDSLSDPAMGGLVSP